MNAINAGSGKTPRKLGAALLGPVILSLFAASPALAQEAGVSPAAAPAAEGPSTNATVNLIRLLVEQKVISAEAGQALLTQAEGEAAEARARVAAAPPPPADGTQRVPYVPQVVRDQIRDEIKAEVMASAQTQGWVAPNTMPDWVDRVKITGDIRFRNESNLFSNTNSNEIVDWDAFNGLGPTDFVGVLQTPPVGIPLLNSRVDRTNIVSIRARIGIEGQVTEGITAGFRLASGNNGGPISTTQLLGGGFDKKAIWLDRAYITMKPWDFATVTAGRMAIPFFYTDMIWDEDLNFDGLAVQMESGDRFGESFALFGTAGYFPFEQTLENFPTFSRSKAEPRDKYILAAQLGADITTGSFETRLAASYYDYTNVRGLRSEPCRLFEGDPQCSTDLTRPNRMVKGNTLFLLRDIVPASPTDISQPQFVGLLFDYNILDLNAQVKYNVSDDLSVMLSGNYIRNLAFDRDDICNNTGTIGPINSLGGNGAGNGLACGAGSDTSNFAGSGTAWLAGLTIGKGKLAKQGEWNAFAQYKHIGSDAVLDLLNDSDFRLGGTNSKGYVLGANYMAFDGTRFRIRWLSADEIIGPPLAVDVLQLDLVVNF